MLAELPSVWETMTASPLAIAVRESVWAYPALETIHLVGLALVFGTILSFDLRVLGFGGQLDIGVLARHQLPWVWGGFAANATSGVLMFVSDAAEFAANPALGAKLALIAIAGLNAALFQKRLAPGPGGWSSEGEAPLAARISAAASIGLWLSIIAAGRLMAYTAA